MEYKNSRIPDKKFLGRLGESLAAEFLLSQSYNLVGLNFHSRYGEIDIIAKKPPTLIFVEVKTRQGLNYGLPEESLKPAKIKRLIKTAYLYLEKTRQNTHWRLDAITIQLKTDFTLESITHYQNLS